MRSQCTRRHSWDSPGRGCFGRTSTCCRGSVRIGRAKGNAQDNSDALVAATSKDHEKVVEVLVSQGANLNRAGRLHASEWLPLQLAANKDKFGMLSILLRLGADPNTIGGIFGSVLMAAADTKKVNCQILEALIVAGADVDELVPPEKRIKVSSKVVP